MSPRLLDSRNLRHLAGCPAAGAGFSFAAAETRSRTPPQDARRATMQKRAFAAWAVEMLAAENDRLGAPLSWREIIG
jgi:hypothetical protein